MMNPTRKIGTVFAEYLRTHEKLTKKKPGKRNPNACQNATAKP